MIQSLFRKVFKRAAKAAKTDGRQGSASKRFYYTPSVLKSLEKAGFTDVTYITVPYRMLTFFGKDIRPKKWNMKVTLFLEKVPRLPVIGPLGGHCLFMAKKTADEN
jgi:hypothetical protein